MLNKNFTFTLKHVSNIIMVVFIFKLTVSSHHTNGENKDSTSKKTVASWKKSVSYNIPNIWPFPSCCKCSVSIAQTRDSSYKQRYIYTYFKHKLKNICRIWEHPVNPYNTSKLLLKKGIHFGSFALDFQNTWWHCRFIDTIKHTLSQLSNSLAHFKALTFEWS